MSNTTKNYKLGIFGESFAYQSENYTLMGGSWMDWISELNNWDIDDILCDSEPGRGNWCNFCNLYTYIEQGYTFDHVIFVSSSLLRLPLVKYSKHSFAYSQGRVDMLTRKSEVMDFNLDHLTEIDKFKSNYDLSLLDFTKCWFDFIHTESGPELVEYINLDATRHAILKCREHNINLTILIPFPDDNKTLKIIQEYDVNIICPMLDINAKESAVVMEKFPEYEFHTIPWKHKNAVYHDPRPCHMISENNKVLAQTIIKCMETQDQLKIYDFNNHPDLDFSFSTLSKYLDIDPELL